MLHRAAAVDAGDPAAGQERVGRHAEDPLAELLLGRGERLQGRRRGRPVQVPPAGAVADQVQHPVGAQSGWNTDSCGPPATVTGWPARASPSRVASRSSVPSQGMFGWSHSSQASDRPSGLTRGLA